MLDGSECFRISKINMMQGAIPTSFSISRSSNLNNFFVF